MATTKTRKPRKTTKPAPSNAALDLETPDGFEILDGELMEKKVGRASSEIASNVLGELYIHCKKSRAGRALQGDTAYRCFARSKTHVRKPDTSFILRDRMADLKPGPGDFPIRPDLVVEVVSPNETADEIGDKVRDWRSVGVPLIWVIYPKSRSAMVFSTAGIHEIGEDDELPVYDILPGFHLKLRDVLLKP